MVKTYGPRYLPEDPKLCVVSVIPRGVKAVSQCGNARKRDSEFCGHHERELVLGKALLVPVDGARDSLNFLADTTRRTPDRLEEFAEVLLVCSSCRMTTSAGSARAANGCPRCGSKTLEPRQIPERKNRIQPEGRRR